MPIKLVQPHDLQESPYQTRNDLSVIHVQDLVRSIRRNGQDEPCEAYQDDNGKLTLIDGHRRVLACAELGRKVRVRIVPKPDMTDILGRTFRRNSVRRPHSTAAVIMAYMHQRVQDSGCGVTKAIIRELSHELNIRYTKVRQCLLYWRKLVEKDPAAAKRAVKEKWSEGEVRVALGLPTQRQHKAKQDHWGTMRPEHVVIRRDPDGQMWMDCRMRADADAELLAAYYRSRRWPEPVIVADEERAPA